MVVAIPIGLVLLVVLLGPVAGVLIWLVILVVWFLYANRGILSFFLRGY